MENFENIIEALDSVLNTRRKRHIMGGILLGISLLFGTMSITVITIDKKEDKIDEE